MLVVTLFSFPFENDWGGYIGLDFCAKLTFLEDLGPIDLHEASIGIFVLLAVIHVGQCDGIAHWER